MAGYGDDAGLTVWLTDNGLTLPEGAPDKAVLRQRGSSYIDGRYGPRFPGTPTGGYAQERAFPRVGATAYGSPIPDSEIPTAIIEASYAAAYQEAVSPGSLSVVVTGAGAVKSEQVASIKVEYFEGSSDALENAMPQLATADWLLAPFLLAPPPKMALGILSIGR